MSNPEASVPPPTQPDELHGTLQAYEFLALLLHYRWLFLIGLLITTGVTFCAVRFVMTKYYRAESLIFVGSRFTPESRAGLAEAEVFEGSRNDTYQTIVQGQLAEELLRSTGLLRAVADRMSRDEPAASDDASSASMALRSTAPPPRPDERFDVAKLLGIGPEAADIRDAWLLRTLRENLIDVKSLQTSGLVQISVELPDPRAARRFLELALDELQTRLNDINWGYFSSALQVYEVQLREEMARRDALARELKEFNLRHGFDRLESLEQKRLAMEVELKQQAGKLAELSNRIEALRMATSPAAQMAAPAFKVINEPQLPLKKSRPQTILSTALAGVLYTFVFLCGMLLVGLLGIGRRRAS